MNSENLKTFQDNGLLNMGKVLDGDELDHFRKMFQDDMSGFPNFWRAYGHHQVANYDALISSPQFDELIRHPKIFPTIEALMGDPVCFGEIGLREMQAYDGEAHQCWHRDKPHWDEHPLRMDYMQLMVLLSDTDETTHCFSISPESIHEPVIEEHEAQFERNGQYDFHAAAGTCILFNPSLLHTATTRPTKAVRKTVQIYYGHRDRPYLANDSAIPATLWRDHPDPETRGFYGVLNERTKIYLAAYPERAQESSS
jgi:ectoine hydroxylase-related dioxygenase (phytanoyl-CoA dioxygenase family)